MGSSHALSQVNKVLASLERDGYGDVAAVRELQEELREGAKQ
ncbi:MAG TPA: hypothetical protein VFV38_11880 [Ktedonobacteraceae bacterium]|nr:hypothetical protein [Ktedonobacteraceae bacterium]